MRRVISIRHLSGDQYYLLANINPGPHYRFVDIKINFNKAHAVQQSVYQFYRSGRARVCPWPGIAIGWEADIE